jgi:gamma-glutamyltranspeptidase / glutathione hydrolase
VEPAKLAFADREAFYGEPLFVDVPIETLLSDTCNAERRTLISDQASLELRPGSIAGAGGKVAVRGTTGKRVADSAMGAGEPTANLSPVSLCSPRCHTPSISRGPRRRE